ncbi:MAG: cytochrome c [Flavobacterium sp.]|nr:MAG: cytochrome c [Flavobacterium sp.]
MHNKFTQVFVLTFLIIFVYACNSSSKNASEIQPIESADLSLAQDELSKSKERGGLIYTDFCMQCHMANGMGITGTFPPLARSSWLKEKRTESIRAVKYGQSGKIEVNGETYDSVMVPMGLSNEEVADVLNYIMSSWGNTLEKMVTPAEVAAVKK